jgi:rhamnosyl/mannosyltransferase
MRVLHFGKYFPPAQGGIETVTHCLAQGLAGRGIACEVLVFNPGANYQRDVFPGYTVHRAACPVVLNSAPLSWQSLNLLRHLAGRFDILHLHLPNPMAALAVWLIRPRIKLVLHWHSDIVRQKVLGPVLRPLERWLIKRADMVIAATPAHVQGSVHRDLIKGKARIIPFCLDQDFASPEKLDQTALARLRERFPGKKAVFSLGRLVSYKGLNFLIDAAKALPLDWVVLIGGEGPLKAELADRIEGLGLGERVILLGAVPQGEIGAHYAFCRVFCLPSTTRAEMFGMVQLEAMAWGKPVVSTDIPGSGVPYVNQHQVTGLTVPPGDASALAKAVLELDADETRYLGYAKDCREVFAKRYTPDAVIPALIGAYQELLGPQEKNHHSS